MNTSSDKKIQQPSIIQALLSGFNTIANHPYLLLFPISLDLFLWFGPAWRVDKVFSPFIQNLSRLSGLDTGEYAEVLSSFQSTWLEILSNLNLAVSLRTFPIGIPSLMASKPSFINPLGQPAVFNLESLTQVAGIWALFLLVGFFLGTMYFNHIACQIIKPLEEAGFKALLRSFIQILILPILLLMLLIILTAPIMLVITAIMFIIPALGQFLFLVAGIILLWIFMPLIFTPHGIFLYQQNLVASMMTSIKIVRLSMGKTAWFFFLSYILVEGLDRLWRTPSVDNWFLFVGISGRAFIVTAVIAASFHFFIDATRFSQSLLNQEPKSA